MNQTIEARNPRPDELFQGFAAALERLGGRDDRTAAAIQQEMAEDAPDFHRAAKAIGVKLDDLVEVFCEEMFVRGFVLNRRYVQ